MGFHEGTGALAQQPYERPVWREPFLAARGQSLDRDAAGTDRNVDCGCVRILPDLAGRLP